MSYDEWIIIDDFDEDMIIRHPLKIRDWTWGGKRERITEYE